jgi:hypothetical protein
MYIIDIIFLSYFKMLLSFAIEGFLGWDGWVEGWVDRWAVCEVYEVWADR